MKYILNNAFKTFLLFLFFSFHSISFASWQKIKVPNSYCGDGRPYSIFVRTGDPDKLLIEFMGGGVCWSTNSCYGPVMRTWLHPVPKLSHYSSFTNKDFQENPFKNHTMIFFPYCTGDFHAAHTVQKYAVSTVQHVGYTNIINSLKHLKDTQTLMLKSFKNVTVFGASAGALGSITHLENINKELDERATRNLILDSPGLQFTHKAWDKFKEPLRSQLLNSLTRAGLGDDRTDMTRTFHSKYLAQFALKNTQWNILLLQATKDFVMSRGFAGMSRRDYKEVLYSKEGIIGSTQHVLNLQTWTIESSWHTFLLLKSTTNNIGNSGESALEFVKNNLN